MRVLRGAQHGARSGMEGSEERGAALRGLWGLRVPWVPSVSELGVTCDLGAMESDLGKGHSSDVERSERSLE